MLGAQYLRASFRKCYIFYRNYSGLELVQGFSAKLTLSRILEQGVRKTPDNISELWFLFTNAVTWDYLLLPDRNL